jgi:hypothetical protein
MNYETERAFIKFHEIDWNTAHYDGRVTEVDMMIKRAQVAALISIAESLAVLVELASSNHTTQGAIAESLAKLAEQNAIAQVFTTGYGKD